MSILDEILEHKVTIELPARKKKVPLTEMRKAALTAPAPRNFAAALKKTDGRVALIAEVKRASPSKGELVKGGFDPVTLGQIYEANGASAISVLTDEKYFKGALAYMSAVKNAVNIPVLRKDFIIDEYQIHEARAAGADAILLIVAALDDAMLAEFYAITTALKMTALVEVHDETEVDRALAVGAQVIGVNNRDLRNFEVNLGITARCANHLRAKQMAFWSPQNPSLSNAITLVSESGISTPNHVARVADMGACAILVGESIIVSANLPEQVQALSSVQL